MNISILSKRILGTLDGYCTNPNNLSYDVESILSSGEQLLGVYNNLEDDSEVWVSTTGIHVRNKTNWNFLKYSELLEVKSPKRKNTVTGLNCLKIDGSEFWIPILGVKSDKFWDAFAFLRFLDRVMKFN